MQKAVLLTMALACGAVTGCGMMGGNRHTADLGLDTDTGPSEAGMATVSATDSGPSYEQYAAYRQQVPTGETPRVAARGPVGTSISYPSYYDQPAASACSSGC